MTQLNQKALQAAYKAVDTDSQWNLVDVVIAAYLAALSNGEK